MSAKKSNVKVQETKVEETNTPLPLDGSKGEQYIKEQGGVSKAIRQLVSEGHKYGPVSKMLGKRYQHVRNVMITPVGKKTTEE